MSEEKQHPAESRDDVATLIRLGGKRQSVPHERSDRARRAAHAQWQESVAIRNRKRYAWSAAGLAAAAILVVALALRILPFGGGAAIDPPGPVLVETLRGPIESRVARGDAIALPAELATEPDSRVAIRLASGHSVRLDGSTAIRLLADGSLAIDRGTVYVDSGAENAAQRKLDLATPFGDVEEIGTQFEVRLQEDDDTLRLRLREGAVILHRDATDHEVRAGAELEIDRAGNVTRRAIPTHGAEWAWIDGVTPMLDLEGVTARAFLDWAARERGLTLAFADEAVARSADRIRLEGAVGGLTPSEALDAVLPTCRMGYRIEGGVLVVAAE